MLIKRIEPGPGQESVWDYPRPPRLERSSKRIRVQFGGITLADSTGAYRLLETSHPPVYYIPPCDIAMGNLALSGRRTLCEWKGKAGYYTVSVGDRTEEDAAWAYLQPSRDYQAIAGFVAFYPSQMDACFVDDEPVRSQEGDFYGGWITSEIVGPFKGGPSSLGW